MNVRSLLREPLTHFLLAGGALFLLAPLWGDEVENGRQIEIDREDLLVFMQGQARVYDEPTFDALLNTMSAEQRAALVHDAALQEALYREGQSLGLAQADPVVRQRIVQQARDLLTSEAIAAVTVDEAEVRAFFDRQEDRYAQPAAITFTHVYVPGDASSGKARRVLAQLQDEAVPAERAARFGERFLYQDNYAAAPRSLVASHFGPDFADAVFDLKVNAWQGPIRSKHGWHLVLPLEIRQQRRVELADVYSRVREDALAETRQRSALQAMDRLLARYSFKTGAGI